MFFVIVDSYLFLGSTMCLSYGYYILHEVAMCIKFTRMLLSLVNFDTLNRFLVIFGTYNTSCKSNEFSLDEPKATIFNCSPLPTIKTSYHDVLSKTWSFIVWCVMIVCTQSTNHNLEWNKARKVYCAPCLSANICQSH